MNNNLRLPTSYKFYWGGSANFKGLYYYSRFVHLDREALRSPQQNLYVTVSCKAVLSNILGPSAQARVWQRITTTIPTLPYTCFCPLHNLTGASWQFNSW